MLWLSISIYDISMLIFKITLATYSMQKKFMLSVSDSMHRALEQESKRLKLDSVQDVARYIFAEYFKDRVDVTDKK